MTDLNRRVGCLLSGEHTTPEFLRTVNRFGKLPAIVEEESGFKLAESIAILRYLSREHSVPDHWYPRDSRRRARVDEYLEWQHSNTRLHCAGYVRYVWRGPLRGEAVERQVAERLRAEMIACLDFIESNLLREDVPFIAGQDISIADLVAACEVEQPSKNFDILSILEFKIHILILCRTHRLRCEGGQTKDDRMVATG